MDDLYLQQVQKAEINILLQIDELCRNHNISYFLTDGTLLGAIRHKGFIPWDDDVDIGMIRSDYEKFLKIAKNELPKGYFLECTDTEKQCPYLYSKVKKDDTVFLEWCHRNLKMHYGIYVDIFPWDYLPQEEILRKKHIRKCFLMNQLFNIRATPDRNVSPQKSLAWLIKAVARRLTHYLFCLFPLTFFIKKANRCFTKYDKTNVLGGPSFMIAKGISYDLIFPLTKGSFESHYFPIPGNSDQYLTALFGDYNVLPPQEERIGHRPYKVRF